MSLRFHPASFYGLVPEIELPIPTYPSRRLIGLEIEIDPGSAPHHEPVLPGGWVSKSDGSLGRGREYVLDPPLALSDSVHVIREFSESVTKSKMHVASRGGYHVHVQAHDYTIQNAMALCAIYRHYQPAIDLLVGASRRGSNPQVYNPPIPPGVISEDFMDTNWKLGRSARNRQEARNNRGKFVLNFSPMRCESELERSIEFRQPSTSKKMINIYGWACFAVALVDFALLERRVKRHLACRPTLKNFLLLVRWIERKAGAQKLCEWVKWRIEYLDQQPNQELRRRFAKALLHKAKGPFSIARELNVNVAVANRLIATGLQKQDITEIRAGKFRTSYKHVAQFDLKMIIAQWAGMENPAIVSTAPARNA